MICSKYSCIFVHIPKAAGTSFEFTLMNGRASYPVCDDVGFIGKTINKFDGHIDFPEGKHEFLRTYQDNFSKVYNDYSKFTFIRNPWARLYSLYGYLRYAQWECKGPARLYEFNEWVALVDRHKDSDKIYEITGHSVYTAHYLLDNSEKLARFDHIGRTETFEKDMLIIANKLGIRYDTIDRDINKSKKTSDYRTAYNNVSKNIIKNISRMEQDVFGYTFDN